jgi:hypothetical protein
MTTSNPIIICEFGTAPEQKAEGYKLSGFELSCKEEDLPSLLRFAGDIRVVKGGLLENGEQCFHVMVKDEDGPVKIESITTIEGMVSKVKQEVSNIDIPKYRIDISNFSFGERAMILADLTQDGYSAFCNETTLHCSRHILSQNRHFKA